jgi:hypothetical protein
VLISAFCKTEGGDVSTSAFLKTVGEICEFPHFCK